MRSIDFRFGIDSHEATPLHYAAARGDFKSVERLLMFEDVDVNALDQRRFSPLHSALSGSYDIRAFVDHNGTVTNQVFRRTFRNSKFFETHVHLGTLTFQKILNHKNFLEKLDL